jgi:hypothetical protein
VNLVKKQIQKLVDDINYRQTSIISACLLMFLLNILGALSSHSVCKMLFEIHYSIFASIGLYFLVERKKIVKQPNTSSSSLIIQLLYISMDEEGRGYLRDQKSQLNNLELTADQLKTKEFLFIMEHYRGRFVSWLKLPRFLSSIRIR